jgi:predicted ATPase
MILVGRNQELARVLRRMEEIEHPVPTQEHSTLNLRLAHCFLLKGDAGIGKTRLAEEIAGEATQKGWNVIWGRTYLQERSTPYRLWTEVLRKSMEQGAWQRQEVSKRSLVFQPLSTLLPDVLRPLLIPNAFSSVVPPEQEQLRLWEATCELLKLISESVPLLIVLDDLHLADTGSWELLAYLARRVRGYPIMIVGTGRENDLIASHPLRSLFIDLQREHFVECISLEPLGDEQIDTIVSTFQIPPALVKQIRHRAVGNPFFAEEFARAFASSDHSEKREELQLRNGTSQLPESIAAMFDLHLMHLSQLCRRLLCKATVLGRTFELSALLTIAWDQPKDQVISLVEEALRARLLMEEDRGSITYTFYHPLLVDHLYSQLSAARRLILLKEVQNLGSSSETTIPFCGACGSHLTLETTIEKYREIIKRYQCLQCHRRYESQFVQISILVSLQGEQNIALARECSLCHALYSDEDEHDCRPDQIPGTS